MSSPWQSRTQCRKCAAALHVTAEAGPSKEPSLAIFYCPVCGDRTQVELPAGYDPLGVNATPDAGSRPRGLDPMVALRSE
jgi:transcription elongation factor Elf1